MGGGGAQGQLHRTEAQWHPEPQPCPDKAGLLPRPRGTCLRPTSTREPLLPRACLPSAMDHGLGWGPSGCQCSDPAPWHMVRSHSQWSGRAAQVLDGATAQSHRPRGDTPRSPSYRWKDTCQGQLGTTYCPPRYRPQLFRSLFPFSGPQCPPL